MLALIMVLTYITILLLAIALLNSIMGEKPTIAARLSKIGLNRVEEHDELSMPLYHRVIKPMIDEASKAIAKIMPSEIRTKIEKKLQLAGYPFGATVNTWLGFQIAIIVGLPIITIVALNAGRVPATKTIMFIPLELAAGIIIPRFILAQKVTERQDEITKTLPDILDLLTVSVEAGLGFDAALARVVDKVPGELSGEFTKVLHEIKVGTPKREALRNLTKRVDVPDLTTFIGAVIQADQLGVSIGNVLRIQSQQMRQKRRQRAQEKAMKAPVKMLFPMVFFIFPTIFAVLLGPALINMQGKF